MGHHHVPALPPPILVPAKAEKPRWRPRAAIPGARPAKKDEVQEKNDGDAVFAAGGPLDEQGRRRQSPGRAKAGPPAPRRGGPAAAALTDDTLRALLIGQEEILNRSG
jgi:hypothetical protein